MVLITNEALDSMLKSNSCGVLSMEALSSLLVRAKEGHFLLSLRVEGIGEAGEGISHLLLAYDTAVFYNIKELALELGCKVGELPTTCLRLPLSAPFKLVWVWDGVEEQFCKRLSLWKRQYISKKGRTVLIHSNLANLPIYFMCLFSIPRKVRLRLKKIQRDILWGGRALERELHSVKWFFIHMEKRQGALLLFKQGSSGSHGLHPRKAAMVSETLLGCYGSFVGKKQKGGVAPLIALARSNVEELGALVGGYETMLVIPRVIRYLFQGIPRDSVSDCARSERGLLRQLDIGSIYRSLWQAGEDFFSKPKELKLGIKFKELAKSPCWISRSDNLVADLGALILAAIVGASCLIEMLFLLIFLLFIYAASDVHETAAGALWNLAFNPHNALRIVEDGGVQALVNLCSYSLSKMARFMAALALAYMFDGR
ncbi:Protein ARABIDILLO 1 [Vitis vinifera]|uniref:Protein ARABIDILLO 1 n=1 Tax=Vitis vinifera TaxID=29760 RepID=A0A438I4Z6_VITVI|nr:Protein ARABIDILLO 1 [Vitis vinifera]